MSRVIIPLALIGLILSYRPSRNAVTASAVTAVNLISKGIDMQYSKAYAHLRGIRNNNAGNIRHGDDWRGMADQQSDRSFITFQSPEWGIRAMGKILMNYQRKHGLNTVAGIIDRWAPPFENNTGAYVNHVAKLLGVTPDQPIEVRDHLMPLTQAIIKHENGVQPYPDQVIKDGLAMV